MAEIFVLLDDARPERGRLRLLTELSDVATAREPADLGPALDKLEKARRSGLFAAGYFAYELGYALEPKLLPLLPAYRPTPLLWFGLFRKEEILPARQAHEWLSRRLRGRAYAGPLRFDLDRAGYAARFARVRDYILAGDVYQVNLTFPARFHFAGDPLALYLTLRDRSSAGHGAFIHDGERSVLSFSPELFFKVEDGAVTARPMKGTAPRAADPAEDARLLVRLKASEKDRAENLMIVDLIRNDLGRVASLGTVRVEDLFSVETYPTVHQMVSTVTAELGRGIETVELVRALFPCGSVTGAPKIRAMEIIRELEKEPRGIYCGAIGCFSPSGAAEFNVAIRTLTITGSEGRLGLGGGIVADSEPSAEYEECLVKARFFTDARQPLSLIETLRFEPGHGLVRLSLHLRRIARSAAALGFPFDREAAESALAARVKGKGMPLRVRLELGEDGSIRVEADPFTPPPRDTVWTYCVSEQRVKSGDVLLQHKTSARTLHDSERAAANRAGADEVLFLNELGEVADGSMTTVFLRRGGSLVTPPLESGALDGCLRRTLLERGECTEAKLSLADLARGEVYLGNSLRGLIRARPRADSR